TSARMTPGASRIVAIRSTEGAEPIVHRHRLRTLAMAPSYLKPSLIGSSTYIDLANHGNDLPIRRSKGAVVRPPVTWPEDDGDGVSNNPPPPATDGGDVEAPGPVVTPPPFDPGDGFGGVGGGPPPVELPEPMFACPLLGIVILLRRSPRARACPAV
ncbi:MAG TPA: hypothetical protein VL282_18855, partial [Tepidisphaeraceae bacterium]|nr:hypothetical protein [Tepidisphaeraceae bacterium]